MKFEPEHETVLLPYRGLKVPIDKGLSKLIPMLWASNVGTYYCCELMRSKTQMIFAGMSMLEEFIDCLSRQNSNASLRAAYGLKEKVLTWSKASRHDIMGFGMTHGGWNFSITTGPGNNRPFGVALMFPPEQIKVLESAFEDYTRSRDLKVVTPIERTANDRV